MSDYKELIERLRKSAEEIRAADICGWGNTCEEAVAAIASLVAERDAAEDALRRHGYRKSCDIPACNCGDQWNHGGHAAERLREISDALPYENGKTLLQRVQYLARAQEEIEGLRKDARRYRWLIARGVFKCDPKMDGMHQWYPIAVPLRGNTLDAAIDSAIAGEQK